MAGVEPAEQNVLSLSVHKLSLQKENIHTIENESLQLSFRILTRSKMDLIDVRYHECFKILTLRLFSLNSKKIIEKLEFTERETQVFPLK